MAYKQSVDFNPPKGFPFVKINFRGNVLYSDIYTTAQENFENILYALGVLLGAPSPTLLFKINSEGCTEFELLGGKIEFYNSKNHDSVNEILFSMNEFGDICRKDGLIGGGRWDYERKKLELNGNFEIGKLIQLVAFVESIKNEKPRCFYCQDAASYKVTGFASDEDGEAFVHQLVCEKHIKSYEEWCDENKTNDCIDPDGRIHGLEYVTEISAIE